MSTLLTSFVVVCPMQGATHTADGHAQQVTFVNAPDLALDLNLILALTLALGPGRSATLARPRKRGRDSTRHKSRVQAELPRPSFRHDLRRRS